MERSGDARKTSSDKTEEQVAAEEEEAEEEKDNGKDNDKAKEAHTSIEDMIRALDATRTMLERAQNAVKTLNSLQINVHFGPRRMQITTLESLNFFWNNVPDTPCLVCGGNFDVNEWPPIRTVSFELRDPDILTHLPIRVHNRHLDCLRKENVKYFTVSHVWHKDIAVANESGNSSTEASIRLMEILVKILNAAVVAFHNSHATVEVWHDYVSVPQWNYAIKDKLLLHLPSIFSASSACLVHLDDFHSSLLNRLTAENPSD